MPFDQSSVKFVYVTSNSQLPASPNPNTVYFSEKPQQIHVGDKLIADCKDSIIIQGDEGTTAAISAMLDQKIANLYDSNLEISNTQIDEKLSVSKLFWSRFGNFVTVYYDFTLTSSTSIHYIGSEFPLPYCNDVLEDSPAQKILSSNGSSSIGIYVSSEGKFAIYGSGITGSFTGTYVYVTSQDD